jgi:hypothetical protein
MYRFTESNVLRLAVFVCAPNGVAWKDLLLWV